MTCQRCPLLVVVHWDGARVRDNLTETICRILPLLWVNFACFAARGNDTTALAGSVPFSRGRSRALRTVRPVLAQPT